MVWVSVEHVSSTTARVLFSLGPAPSEMVSAWIANARRLLSGVRRHRAQLSIDVHDDLVDLCELLLDIWDSVARRSDTFTWSRETDVDQVFYLVHQWLEIGSLTDGELELMQCTWAPEWTRPFADALVAGATAALEGIGERGEQLKARLVETS